MYVFTYIYNKLFVNSNKIKLENRKRHDLIKADICNSICEMKELHDHEMLFIKKMSHHSLVEVIELLFAVNNNMINVLNNDEYTQIHVDKNIK